MRGRKLAHFDRVNQGESCRALAGALPVAQRPLATVIIGGLTSTLIFAPIVIPPLYFLVERKRFKEERTNT